MRNSVWAAGLPTLRGVLVINSAVTLRVPEERQALCGHKDLITDAGRKLRPRRAGRRGCGTLHVD